MKKLFLVVALLPGLLFAQEANKLRFNLVSDLVYVPKTDFVAGDDHFAPLTGPFAGVQNREVGHVAYTLSTPLGDNPLLQYSNLTFDLGLELTVINATPQLSVTFMPIPFLMLSAGGSFGIGWSVFDVKCISQLDKETGEWNKLTTFKNNYYDAWLAGTLQFDLGAFIPSEWSHVIIQATYKSVYKGMTGMDKGDIWGWQGAPNMTNGLQYEQSYLVGYHFPKIINVAGAMVNLSGYYDANAFGKDFDKYDSDFMNMSIQPIFEFAVKRDIIDVLFIFTGTRSFEEDHDSPDKELYLTTCGREWKFQGIVVSWNHSF